MKYKNVLLINPYPDRARGINESTIYPPLGLAYLASVLRNNEIQVKIVDANILKLGNNQVMKILSSQKPDLIGIGLNIVSAKSGIELSQLIRNTTDVDICLGGSFASSNIEYILRKAEANFVVVGEGEDTLLEICKGRPLAETTGIAWRTPDNNIMINEPANLIQNLDELPFPAYDLLPSLKLYRSRARKLPASCILTSRGCPFRCTFCNHNIFGKKFRASSPKKVIEEIEFLISRYGIKQFDILDDNFTHDIKRAEEILDLIIKKKFNILINLQNGIRANRLTYPLVKKMKKAGIFKVGIGCESGNRQILKEVKKDLDLQKVKQALRWFKKERIISYCFFVFGFPTDTKQTVWDTINFALESDTSNAVFSTLMPFPGTELYSFLRDNKLLDENLMDGLTTGFYGSKLYHKCLNLTEQEILDLQATAYRKFYLRYNKIIEIMLQIKSFNELRWYFNLLKGSFPIVTHIFNTKKPALSKKVEGATSIPPADIV